MNTLDLHGCISTKTAVIFDLYHTLTATEVTSPHGLSTSTILGIDKKVWNMHLLEKSRKRLTGKETDAYSIIKNLAHSIDPFISEELIHQATQHRMMRFEESLIRMPEESTETVKKLKAQGKKIALLSNADAMETGGWKKSPISPFFDVVIFSCEVGFMKPDREIYEICLNRLNEKPENCVFVGDGGSNEFIGAKELGISTIMITGIAERIWPEKLTAIKAHADYIINEVAEMIPA